MDTEDLSANRISSIVPRLFPSLGPVLLISLGYIDPGKWAAAVDGGARFGFDLVLLVLAFSCTAIMCQYISACVAVVTGKNLAQICSEEYTRPTCILLGVQAELSVIALELTTILGISHGLNFLFGLDLFICILLTASDAVLFPLLTTLLDKCKTEMLFISIAGLALLFYVLGILTSQPEIPLVLAFPRLKGENAYTLMSLLGASIMPHNFYLHSSIIQQQQQWRRQPRISIGTLCHEHFFAIVCIFSVIFLVNSVVMLSAATLFHSAGLAVTFQDILFLMDQIFWSPIVPFAFFLVLFFSSQVITLTWNVGGQVLLHDFYGINPPVWMHRATVKALAIIPSLFCAWNSGAEGIYQLLIFSQVILALLLPSSVIPLFRIASSGTIMGAFKISRFMEILALLAFLGMLASNIFFILEMLFGDADWIGWNISNGTTIPYVIVFLVACSSFALMLWLAATPLKSARASPNMQISNLALQMELLEPSDCREGNGLNRVQYDGDEELIAEHAPLDRSVLSCSENSVLESEFDLPETIMDSDHDQPQQSSGVDNNATASTAPTSHTEESTSADELAPIEAIVDEASTGGGLGSSNSQKIELNDLVGNTRVDDLVGKTGVEVDVQATVKDDDEVDVWEPEESPGGISGSISSSTYEGPGSFRNVSGKNDDGGSGSLSRLSGLGRAARRQLAAVLDEFWGQLYDFHGQVTKEAKAKGIDVILGLESKPVVSTQKTDVTGAEYDRKHLMEAERGSTFLTNSRDYDYLRQQRMSNLESSCGIQAGISSWSSYVDSLDAYVQSSRCNQLNANEKRYSSLRLPSYSDERDYQPATIHGYQMASYLSRIVADRNADSLSIPLDPSTPKSTSHFPNYRNPLTSSPGQIGYSSLHTSSMQNPSLASRLQVERPYYDASLVGTGGDIGSSAYPKKYHSLPDISGLAISNRNSSLANRNAQWSNPIAPRPSVGKIPYEQSSYSFTSSSAEGVPLAFDELSPSKHYRDPFSMPLSSNLDTKSLWSRQPFEQLFGIAGKPRSGGHEGVLQNTVSLTDSEAKLLQTFRYCILKLLKLEGSDWLFRQNGGFDEELIERVAAKERFLYEAEGREVNRVNTGDSPYMPSDGNFCLRNEEACLTPFDVSLVPPPHCGDGCIWQVGLIVSFGVWCIRRILELSIMESRPELWGKYTYVLNRLQGILDPAFFKPRPPISPCSCLRIPSTHAKRSGLPLPNELSPTGGKASRGRCTSAVMLLELIKDVEAAVSCRKGRTGTAAGDVAFPKGKENLASVLKRYKRRLSNKSIGAHDGGPVSRKVPMPTSFMQ